MGLASERRIPAGWREAHAKRGASGLRARPRPKALSDRTLSASQFILSSTARKSGNVVAGWQQDLDQL